MSHDMFNGAYYESFSQSVRAKEAILFLHGYPANQSDKNRGIAEAITRQTNIDSFIIHYPGLGNSPGQFSFKKSIQISNEFYDFLVKKGYEKVHIFGHSWGGLVGLSIFSKRPQKDIQLILVSPFLVIPEGSALTGLVNVVYASTEEFLKHTSPQAVVSELQEIGTLNNFKSFQRDVMANIQRVSLFQAITDDETPVDTAREFVKPIPSLNYVELNTDHSFISARDQLIELAIKALAQGHK